MKEFAMQNNMENHIPSLELCKKLKEEGYPQEGQFWWHRNPCCDWHLIDGIGRSVLDKIPNLEFVVAPTSPS